MRKEKKFIKARVREKDVEKYLNIAKDCGVTKSDLITGIFKTMGQELVKVNNSKRREKIKELLKEKCRKIKEEKGYLSFTDLFSSLGSTYKAGCDDISNDMNVATKKKAIDLQNKEVKKESTFDVDKVKT